MTELDGRPKPEETRNDDDFTVSDKSEDVSIPILARATHRFPFEFRLAESTLPCSFESRIGTVRYYLRVLIDIPYASPPQGLKYFTLIGPHIDCMDERYMVRGNEKKREWKGKWG